MSINALINFVETTMMTKTMRKRDTGYKLMVLFVNKMFIIEVSRELAIQCQISGDRNDPEKCEGKGVPPPIPKKNFFADLHD